MIALENVTKTYRMKGKRTVAAVQDVSLRIERGEFVVLTGRSGSGKTTVLNLAAGLARPTEGRVTLDGVEAWRLPDAEQSALRNTKIGIIFQFPSLLPSLTALENVMLPRMFGAREKREGVRERAADLLERLGLADKLQALPRQLSGGQQQRVVIARALLNEPELVLADEPTSDLDRQTEREIMALLAEIHERSGVTMLLVTHAGELESFGTRTVMMEGGRIVEQAASSSTCGEGSRP